MTVSEQVPDEFRQRKHNLGLEVQGRKTTWALLIELGLEAAEKIKALEAQGAQS